MHCALLLTSRSCHNTCIQSTPIPETSPGKKNVKLQGRLLDPPCLLWAMSLVVPTTEFRTMTSSSWSASSWSIPFLPAATMLWLPGSTCKLIHAQLEPTQGASLRPAQPQGSGDSARCFSKLQSYSHNSHSCVCYKSCLDYLLSSAPVASLLDFSQSAGV